ncbi:MAG: hypothetical protein DCC49_01650 [Acidobacteria bacterium]|nr:MAG: hypothetical protein DCC49_01650 [Acidobacteriota bacterium]
MNQDSRADRTIVEGDRLAEGPRTRAAFWKDVAETAAARFLLLGVSAVSTIFIARVLGPDGRGAYAVAVTISAVGIRFGNLGLHSANTYFVARDRADLPRLLGNSLVVGLLVAGAGALGVGLMFVAVPPISPLAGWLLALALAWVPIGLTYLLLQNLLIGIGEIRAVNLIEIFGRTLPVGLMLALLLIGWKTPAWFMAAGFVGLVLAFLWVLVILERRAEWQPKPSLRLFKANISFSFKAYVAAFFAYVVLRSDLLVISYLRGLEDVGYYSVAVSITEVLSALPIAIGTVLFPRLSALESEDDKRKIAIHVAVITGLLLGVASLAAGMLANPLISFLFGADFLPASSAFVWLLPGIVAISVNRIFMNYFASMGMPAVTVWSPAAAAAINVVLNLVLVPRLGIVGASITSTIAYLLMLLTSIAYMRFGSPRTSSRGSDSPAED